MAYYSVTRFKLQLSPAGEGDERTKWTLDEERGEVGEEEMRGASGS
jgi:hypothetical protein